MRKTLKSTAFLFATILIVAACGKKTSAPIDSPIVGKWIVVGVEADAQTSDNDASKKIIAYLNDVYKSLRNGERPIEYRADGKYIDARHQNWTYTLSGDQFMATLDKGENNRFDSLAYRFEVRNDTLTIIEDFSDRFDEAAIKGLGITDSVAIAKVSVASKYVRK